MSTTELTGAVLAIRYVPVKQVMLWERNPKLHDIPKLAESIARHGFRDAPIFDGNLPGIIAGNGRALALHHLFAQKAEPPLGVAVDAKGAWHMPVQFGIDAPSIQAAEEFGVDHNNLVLAGGDFTDADVMRLWDESGYKAILADLEASSRFSVSVGRDAVEEMLQGFDRPTPTTLIPKAPPAAPEGFQSYDDDTHVLAHRCPKCGFEFDD